MLDDYLCLSDPPLASGRTRHIHAHPHRADRLVKVMRADFVQQQYGVDLPWLRRYKRLRRTGALQCYLRELREYLAVHARFPTQQSPLAPITGLVATDRGLGLVVARVVDGSGALAPSVDILIRRNGLTPELLRLLDRFQERLLACDVIVHDLSPHNVLLSGDADSDADLPQRLLLVDGFGERHAIPVCSISRRFNRFNTRRHFARMMKELRELANGVAKEPAPAAAAPPA